MKVGRVSCFFPLSSSSCTRPCLSSPPTCQHMSHIVTQCRGRGRQDPTKRVKVVCIWVSPRTNFGDLLVNVSGVVDLVQSNRNWEQLNSNKGFSLSFQSTGVTPEARDSWDWQTLEKYNTVVKRNTMRQFLQWLAKEKRSPAFLKIDWLTDLKN